MLLGIEYDDQIKALVASYYNESHVVDYIAKSINSNELFNWRKAKMPTPHVAFNNNYVSKEFTSYISRFRIEELYLTYFNQNERDTINSFNLPQKYYLDIENHVPNDGSFTKPEQAKYPVNLITFVVEDNIIVLTTFPKFTADEMALTEKELYDHLGKFSDKFNIFYYHYETEKELLEKFFHEVLPKIPLMTGWNVIEYDWQYMFNRATQHQIPIVKKLPSKSLYGKFHIPIHMGIIDYIEAMGKFRPLKMVENLTLDYISGAVLGVKKLPNPYPSMYDFIKKDPRRFTLYNIIDTYLLKLIDNKLDLITASCMISKISETELNRIFGPVFMTELFLMRGYYKQGKHLYQRTRGYGVHKKYEGAFVFEPVPGYYENIVAFDFSSMYPHLQIQFNMSPDAYLGTLKEVDLGQLIKNQFVVTENDTVFDITFDSITKKLLQRLYGNRKEANNTIDDIKLELKHHGMEV